MRLVELLEYVQVVEARMLGNPDMFNMKVSDSLTYMKRCNGHEDINGKKHLVIATWLKPTALSDCSITRKP
jgi:hypothetical protein